MKVVDIHPEELIDKLSEGSLTPAERERLNLHLALCSSCRFEVAVRADVAQDAPAIEERPQLSFSATASSATRERILASPPEPSLVRASRSARPRSRRRWPLTMLAAALVLTAGGAMAAAITGAVGGHWLGWAPEPKPAQSAVPVSGAKALSKVKNTTVAGPAMAAAPKGEALTASSAEPAAPPTPAPSALPAPTAAPIPTLRRSMPSEKSPASLPAPDKPRAGALGAFPAASAGDSTDASVKRADAAALFAEANRARRDGNADRAVGLYRALQSRYPNSSEGALSRALLAQLLLDRGNPEAALAGFDRYLAEGAPVLSAEALVGRARALEQLGRSTQAAAAWRLVQSRFPGSVHARLAATRLAALGMR